MAKAEQSISNETGIRGMTRSWLVIRNPARSADLKGGK